VAFVFAVLVGIALTAVSVTRAIRLFSRDVPRLPFGVTYDVASETISIHDFATTLAFTRFVWRERPPRPYGVEAHQAMMRAWTGTPISLAMPFGYPPTMLVVLAPLLVLDPVVSYLVWALAPVLLLLGWSWSRRGEVARGAWEPWVGVLTLQSAACQGAVGFGQNALWILLASWVLYRNAALDAAARPKRDLVDAACLVFLTVKPPAALAAALALLWMKRFRALTVAALATAVVLTSMTFWLGPTWLGDYLSLLAHYNPDAIPAAFRPFVRVESMSNLVHFLHDRFGIPVARGALISNGAWLAVATVLTWHFLGREAREPAFCVALGLTLYAVLCSHLNFPDDVLIVVGTLLVCGTAGTGTTTRAGVVGMTWVILNVGVSKYFWPAPAGTHAAFLIKMLFLVTLVVVRFGELSPAGAPRPAAR
jgi:hypothetical protein